MTPSDIQDDAFLSFVNLVTLKNSPIQQEAVGIETVLSFEKKVTKKTQVPALKVSKVLTRPGWVLSSILRQLLQSWFRMSNSSSDLDSQYPDPIVPDMTRRLAVTAVNHSSTPPPQPQPTPPHPMRGCEPPA